ncbi:sensor protein SrrB [Saccharicrinis fermentans DSM 9555 = JCM 21142]|uniref:histidine kinase n=2 Tax=Saccharicrinis fermentans TaxID=982 RepID=W7YK73_9BACT|nr:sensor protein SrrB [Saccharicrinis fermentans DSM 9555 = JCM 21142]
MNKKYIYLLSFIIAASLGGIIYIQTLWMKNDSKRKEQEFDKLVKQAMGKVIERLEREENSELATSLKKEYRKKIQASKNLPKELQRDPKYFNGEEQESALSDDEILDISFRFQLQNNNISTTLQTFNQDSLIFSLDNRSPISTRSSKFGPLTSALLSIQDELKSKVEDKAEMILNTFFPKRTITERVDREKVDVLLMKELEDRGITLQFEFAIYDGKGKMAMATTGYKPDESKTIYQKYLFPNDPHPEAHHLNLFFTERPNFVVQSIATFIPSAAFTLVMIFTSIITIMIIFKQKRLDEIKNDFINNMTHEFKTPISTISLASQMLKDPSVAKTPKTLQHISGVIQDESKRLSFQVEKVLQMAIFDKGKSGLKIKKLDINHLIHNVSTNFKLKVENKKGKIIESLDARNSTVYVDEVHFTNVIYNLFDNAFKYRKGTPILQVKTWNKDNGVVISVKDNGMGISKENLNRIFEKFYRVPTGNVHNVKGFGLGLAYVKKIVDDHGGNIVAKSELNVGTKFEIFLPIKSTKEWKKNTNFF